MEQNPSPHSHDLLCSQAVRKSWCEYFREMRYKRFVMHVSIGFLTHHILSHARIKLNRQLSHGVADVMHASNSTDT